MLCEFGARAIACTIRRNTESSAARITAYQETTVDRLIDGYRRFRAEVWPAQRSRYAALAREGQNPDTLVIAC